MLDGGQFVEALGRLGYPGASSLRASEFDWLFDCAPENLHFLRFFCRSLNRTNVITPEEAHAFQELRKSGKPLLDEAALDEVLKTIGASDGSVATLLGSSSSSDCMFGTDVDVTIEDLETELQALRKEKELKQRRYNRLQVVSTSRADVNLRLTAELERAASKLKKTSASVGAENADTNTLLQNLSDEVMKLASYLPAHPEARQKGNKESVQSNPSLPKGHDVLLSQLSIDSYLHQEELNTKTLTAFTKKHFFQGISDIVETSCSGRFKVLDLSSCEVGEEEEGVFDGEETEKSVVERRRTEMARLQWSYIVTQHQLMHAMSEEKSVKAGLEWLSEKSSHIRSISNSSSLHVRDAVSRKELQAVEAELEALLHGPVPAALRESARLLNVPIVRGDLDLQLARQNYYTSRQDRVRDYLLRQKASFDLVLLAQEMELKRWRTCATQLGEVNSRMVMECDALTCRVESLAHPDLAINPKPNPIISCKDAAFSRLLRILDHDSDRGRSEPFRTYEALDQAARDLAGNLQMARDALGGDRREQHYTAARLYGDCEALHRTMYMELQQLVLGPQVRPTIGTDLELICPNAQAIDGCTRDPQVERSRCSNREEMEHSSRLYSGPLSQEAQKVLVALRAQSFHTARRNCNYSYNHRQIERYGSQGEAWTQSRSTSQEERKHSSADGQSFQTYSQTQDCSLSSFSSSYWDSSFQRQTPETEGYYQRSQMYFHTKDSEPSASQSIPALTFSEHVVSEMPVSSSHGDEHTPSIQIPQTLPDAAFWSMPSPTIRPSFNISLSPDNRDTNELLIPTIEKANVYKEESALAYQTHSYCYKVNDQTDNGTSATQKNKEWWNNQINEAENSEALEEWKQSLSDPNNDATKRVEDGGLSKQSRMTHLCSRGILQRVDTSFEANSHKSLRPLEAMSVTELNIYSESMACQMSHTESEIEPTINGTVKVDIDRILPTEKRPATEINGLLNLGMTANRLQGSSYLVTASNRDKNSACIIGETGINKCIVSACEAELPSGSDNKMVSSGNNSKILPSVLSEEYKNQTEGTLLQCQHPAVDLVETGPNNLERTTEDRGVDITDIGLKVDIEMRAKADIDTEVIMDAEQPHCSVMKTTEKQDENKKASDLDGGDKGLREIKSNGHESVNVADGKDQRASTEGRKGRLTPSECRARGSGIEVRCLCANVLTANGYIRGEKLKCGRQNTSSEEDRSSAEINLSVNRKNSNLSSSQTDSHHASLDPLFSLKRKHEVLQDQNVNNFHKVQSVSHPPKWEPPFSSQESTWKGEVHRWKTAVPKFTTPEHWAVAPEPQNKARYACGSEIAVEIPEQTQQWKTGHRGLISARSPFKQTQCSMTCGSYNANKFGPEITNESQTYHKGTSTGKTCAQFTAGCPAATLVCDPRIKNFGKLNSDEKMQLLEEVLQAEALVLTMMYQDGTTQLDPEQKSTPPVCGLLVMMKNDLDSSTAQSFLRANDSLVYLKLEQTPKWAQHNAHESQRHFTRDVLLQVLSRSQPVICYKAKALLRTALQCYKQDFNWKQVAGCHIQDPQVSGWLLDPADSSSCYQNLLSKHCRRPSCELPALGTKKSSQVISALASLYWLNKELCSKLQSQGLWDLYSDMELNMIPVLAAMESNCIHVDKETLKSTSDLLGTKIKQLEQEAHQAAGQIFLVTSNSQLRTVLFEKLRLHERCENKKLPKTINKQQQSTSEATLLQLQHLHPLPKVILEYRQVHKIKSTFVDGILSCMINKSYISSTWYQTSAVTGRISSKHPNFQALPKQPLQITKKPSIQGREEEVVTVHPRAVFIPQEGWTFLAADFCQVELRLLAHLSSDPELLRIFTNPQADVFTMLASQWKGIGEDEVTPEDREHAKRIVYSVVYGAGSKRLSGILGVSAEQASHFQDSFLQTYKEVDAFVHRTILQCHKQGYVLSIMGRRRTLPNINSPDWAVRMQAERQAVNFVVQGSAADLCKMAMIRIFNLVSSSSALSARLVAQLHDELLYEVEDSQVEHFAALVKSTMESLQHIHQFGVHLKVPLKVAVSSGKSWGSMSELNIPSKSPISCL